jgi:hypothetical protein
MAGVKKTNMKKGGGFAPLICGCNQYTPKKGREAKLLLVTNVSK